MASKMQADWAPLLSELERRREIAVAAGDPDRVAREHRYGRSTARERIRKLSDPGSFLEVGTLVTTPMEDGRVLGPTFVCGLCEVDGRPVAVGAEEFSIEHGAAGVHLARFKGGWGGFIEEFALGYQIPLVLLLNGAGGSVVLQELIGYPEIQPGKPAYPLYEIMDHVPVLTAVLGPSAGSSAARAHMAHFSVMTKDNGCVFAGGPPVVKQALGLDIDKFTLGGVDVHTRISGLINNQVPTENEAISALKTVLSYLPDNIHARPSVRAEWDAEDQEELLAIATPSLRRAYDVQALIKRVVDRDSFFEFAPDYGRSLRTGLARIEGHTVGILASDSRFMAGALDAPSSLKQTQFVATCDRFNIPIAYFADVPGFLVGPKAEEAGVLRFGCEAVTTIQRAKVPVYTVQIRRSYGLGGVATGNVNPMSIRLVWPSASCGDMPVEGGIEAAFRAELEATPPEHRAALREKLRKRFDQQTSIWRAMEFFSGEEMIDPRETRSYLARLLRLAYRHPLRN